MYGRPCVYLYNSSESRKQPSPSSPRMRFSKFQNGPLVPRNYQQFYPQRQYAKVPNYSEYNPKVYYEWEAKPRARPVQPSKTFPTTDNYEEDEQYTGPVVTAYGTISVFLNHLVRVDLTVDKAIRVVNFATGCVAAMNSTGEQCCILHPSGRVLNEGSATHMETGNELLKMTNRGVVFTALDHGLVYVVDASGTKSTTERFRDLQLDFSVDLYYNGSFHGREAIPACYSYVDNMFHNFYQYHMDEVWTIAGVRIKQGQSGDVRITRDFGRSVLRTSPNLGTVSVSTPAIHMSATLEPDHLFFVRMGNKAVSVNNNSLMVRNGTQKAGFDNKGKIILS